MGTPRSRPSNEHLIISIEYHLPCGCGRKKTAEFQAYPWLDRPMTVRSKLPSILAWAAERVALHECKR